MAATATLREALNHGISTGNFIDTKIILYSHKDSYGRVCQPKALYANSHTLKTVSYFNDCEYITTFNTARTSPHVVALECSSGVSPSPDRKTSRTLLINKNTQRTTDTCPTATSRTIGTSKPRISLKPIRSLTHPTPLLLRARTRFLTRSTRNELKKGRW